MQRIIFWSLLLLMASSCNKCGRRIKDIVPKGENVTEHVTEDISLLLEADSSVIFIGKDSLRFKDYLIKVYNQNEFKPFWTEEGKITKAADSLNKFIEHGIFYGLNSNDYLLSTINEFQNFEDPESHEPDAVRIAKYDIALTEAFLRLKIALRYGRNHFDIEQKHVAKVENQKEELKKMIRKENVANVLASYEPKTIQYHELKKALSTYIYNNNNPWKTPVLAQAPDTLKAVIIRLRSENFIPEGVAPDSIMLVDAIKCFQERYGLDPDGEIGPTTIRLMDIPFGNRLETVGKNLDRWREMSDSLSENFLLVNIPACELKLYKDNQNIFQCRVIVGEVEKQTPLLTSYISNILTYPYWHVPYSIATKEILPKLNTDTSYLTDQNMEVLDRNGNIIDAAQIDWSKFNERNFTYTFRQREGNENSLGIIKFNFKNKHGVYLHDTNARGLFAKSKRALSHGCVRVEKPLELAEELLKNNASVSFETVRHSIATKERRSINLKTPYPIFIRYLTVGVKDGQIVFYPDLYGKD